MKLPARIDKITQNRPASAPYNFAPYLGMGKPLGLGAVRLESRLIRTNRKSRYDGLFDQEGWLTGSDQVKDQKLEAARRGELG